MWTTHGDDAVLVCPKCANSLVDDALACIHCGVTRPSEGWDRETHRGTTLLGRFEVLRRIGGGTTGSVWEAKDLKPESDGDARVAVKYLNPRFAMDRKLRARFRREALAACQVVHPGVARAIAFGELDIGSPYLVMEYVAGQPLDLVMRAAGPMSVERAVTLGAQIADALHAAHSVGVIHRDLKPSNVYVVPATDGEDERVKLLDFGFAFIDTPERGGVSLTATGLILGTPTYMAPEQTRAKRKGGSRHPIDGRCDLYSLGGILYRMISGKAPLTATSVIELVKKQRHVEPPTMREAAPDLDVDPKLDKVVMRLLAKDPAGRYSDAPAAAAALLAVIAPQPRGFFGKARALLERLSRRSPPPPPRVPPTES